MEDGGSPFPPSRRSVASDSEEHRTDAFDIMSPDPSTSDSADASEHTPAHTRPHFILALLLVSNVWAGVMTTIPVFAKKSRLGDFGPMPTWFTGGDIFRFVEPMVSLSLHVFILIETGIFAAYLRPATAKSATIQLCIFGFFCALYQQGAGYHSASNMFKHPVEYYIQQNQTACARDPKLEDIYLWMQTTWEHYISHYWYAFGNVGMAMVWAWVCRDLYLPHGLSPSRDRALYVAATISYGIVIGAVAINFPYGSVVCSALCVVYGGFILGPALYQRGDMFSWGKRFMLQYFFFSHMLALFICVIWIAAVGGLSNRSQAGLSTK
jgi:hypothetical protein